MPRSWKVNETTPDALDWKRVKKEGFLTKMGGGQSLLGRKSWKNRFFVLENAILSYAEEPDGAELGVIQLKGATVTNTSTRTQNEIELAAVSPEKRVYYFRTDVTADHEAWLVALTKVINSKKRKKTPDMLLEVAVDGIRLIYPDTDEVAAFFKLNKLRNWKATSDGHFVFCAHVKKQPKNFMFQTKHGPEIARELNSMAKKASKHSTLHESQSTSYYSHMPSSPRAPSAAESKKMTIKKSGGGDADDIAKLARALYDYHPDDPSRLPVRRGDVVRVTRIVSDDWWRGHCHGKKGLVPRVYLRPCLQEIIGRAVQDFDDGKSKHLRFRAGDKIVLLTRVGDSEWFDGLHANGEVGIFPVNHVKIVEGKTEFKYL